VDNEHAVRGGAMSACEQRARELAAAYYDEGRVPCPDCGKMVRVTSRIDGLYVCIDCWERRYQVKFKAQVQARFSRAGKDAMTTETTPIGAGESSPAPDGSRCCSCGETLPRGVKTACDRCLHVYVMLRAIDEMDAMIEERRKRDSANSVIDETSGVGTKPASRAGTGAAVRERGVG
jgi:hypothetical protein